MTLLPKENYDELINFNVDLFSWFVLLYFRKNDKLTLILKVFNWIVYYIRQAHA